MGTCGALEAALGLGDLVIVTEAIAADGASRALGAADRVTASAGLLGPLRAAAGDQPAVHTGPVVSTDLFYDDRGLERHWSETGALAVEMEAATLFTLAGARRFDAAALLVVSDVVLPARRRIGQDELRTAERRMGEMALRALAPGA